MTSRLLLSLNVLFITFSVSLQAEEIPLGNMPDIVQKQLPEFINDSDIRDFLQTDMIVNIANSGIKLSGSSVLAYTHPEIIPSDIDLVAISNAASIRRIEALFYENFAESKWSLKVAKRHDFSSFYGDFRGALATFTHKISGLAIDVFFLTEEDYLKKDPVFSHSSKYFNSSFKKN